MRGSSGFRRKEDEMSDWRVWVLMLVAFLLGIGAGVLIGRAIVDVDSLDGIL